MKGTWLALPNWALPDFSLCDRFVMEIPLPDHVPDIRIDDYVYELPASLIADYPLAQRDQSKLLISRNGQLSESRFHQIDQFLDPDSMLIMNNTRVVQARLLFAKPSGARVEIFCLEPLYPVADMERALSQGPAVEWKCLVGQAKKWKSGKLSHENQEVTFWAELIEKTDDHYRIRFSWKPDHLSFGQVLELAGHTPLPPYIKRAAELTDRQTYQTVYARARGSVAAPTAGLHFTEELFKKLRQKGLSCHALTLHVGAGTFKPVSTETIGRHQMHQEQFHAGRPLIEAIANHDGPLVAVGTTSMRTLESLYWTGVRLLAGDVPASGYVHLTQWFPYSWDGVVPSRAEAMRSILDWLDREGLDGVHGETSLIIVPGYRFHVVDTLITNFHQPRSTLLLLVAAFTGPIWKDAYQYALDNGFRFLSYGDSCLFFKGGHADV